MAILATAERQKRSTVRGRMMIASMTCFSHNENAQNDESHPSLLQEEEDDNNVLDTASPWTTLSEICRLDCSPWVTLIGERLLLPDPSHQQTLDYWRVEKAHSVVIVTIQNNQLVFPKPSYRPGVAKCTLDFPGGRVPPPTATTTTQKSSSSSSSSSSDLNSVVYSILQRELGVSKEHVESLISLNHHQEGWPVNSSFSNQCLFGFVARIKNHVELNPQLMYKRRFTVNDNQAMRQLLDHELACLQCRAVLMEYIYCYTDDNDGKKSE
jgi:hypothetical protein